MVPATALFWVIVAALYAIIGAFWAGAARMHGELLIAKQWLKVMSGERVRMEDWPAPRYKFVRIYPILLFFFWPVVNFSVGCRKDRARRAEGERRAR